MSQNFNKEFRKSEIFIKKADNIQTRTDFTLSTR